MSLEVAGRVLVMWFLLKSYFEGLLVLTGFFDDLWLDRLTLYTCQLVDFAVSSGLELKEIMVGDHS